MEHTNLYIQHRYENWTTPEYYKQAEDAVRMGKQNKEKAVLLERRRNALREQLDRERVENERALEGN